jgi:hypothetical protein
MVNIPVPFSIPSEFDNSDSSRNFVTVAAGETLFRILSKEDAAQYPPFREKLLQGRFDHQLQGSADRATMYAAKELSACVVEVFGYERRVVLSEHLVASITFDRDLRLLDLRGSAAMRVGTAAAISAIRDRKLTQDYSRFCYETFTRIDGLIYASAHNQEDLILLYERCEENMTDFRMKDFAEYEREVREIASENGLKGRDLGS